jgi:hypothetical protein
LTEISGTISQNKPLAYFFFFEKKEFDGPNGIYLSELCFANAK